MMGELERDGFCEADQVLYPDVVQIPPTPETFVLLETATDLCSFSLCPWKHTGGRLLLVHLGALPSQTRECLSSVGGPVGQIVSSALGCRRQLTGF